MKAAVPVFAAALGLASAVSADICTCEVCPQRQNDFCWENDKFGMRAYGPGEYHKWSGFDVFNKLVGSGPASDLLKGKYKNWHNVPANGVLDNYTMGASRGVGGIAMFADGEWKTYPDWVESRILHTGDDCVSFELVYPAFSAAGRMTCRITLKRGERFFRNDVSFERMNKLFKPGPGLDLDPSRDHRGSLFEEPGLVSLFEDPKGENGSQGSTMTAVFAAPGDAVETLTDHLNCRVLAFPGRKSFTYWAGAAWSLAGEITTAEAWHAHVRAFRARLAADR